MSLTHEQMSALVKGVLLERPESLRMRGLSCAENARGRLEVFIMVEGCHGAACLLSLNLARTTQAQFERDLRDELVRALNRHLSEPASSTVVLGARIAPLFNPSGAVVVLDVTLHRCDAVRRWTIHTAFPDGWACRLMTETGVTVSFCKTEDEVVAKQREWRAEIAAARAEGWT
jgi:hypothetical protein